MATPNKPKSDWIELLSEANASRVDKIPAGYKSMGKWLEEFEISETTWRRRIPILEESGAMVRGHFRVIEGDGRAIKRVFWKKKK
jgi:hypothetical protein